jgi:hypothetical protein
MINPTILVCQTRYGWTWYVPAYDKYKDVKRGPFKIAALARKDCFFYLENRKRIDELTLGSKSRLPRVRP